MATVEGEDELPPLVCVLDACTDGFSANFLLLHHIQWLFKLWRRNTYRHLPVLLSLTHALCTAHTISIASCSQYAYIAGSRAQNHPRMHKMFKATRGGGLGETRCFKACKLAVFDFDVRCSMFDVLTPRPTALKHTSRWQCSMC